MEDNIKKCSKKEHKDINAIYYCQNCKIYICNKCLNYHQVLFDDHQLNNIENNKEIFIDICKEKNHQQKLEFYCKDHNKLCCAACLTKIEKKGYGNHKNCDVCIIEHIKDEKKNKLKDNIKYLEDLSNNLNDSINELKILSDKIEERKDELKTKIQNIFTKIRNTLNEREDELLSEIDNKFKNLYCNEDIIKESEKLPNKIKLSLEKGKLINNDWDNNNELSSILNNCINIEDNIKKIKIINNNIKKCKNNNDIKVGFNLGDEYLDKLIKNIKELGKIYDISPILNLDSLILKNKDELDKFYSLLLNQIKINNMKLLFRSSRDGLKLDNLKNKINNKSNLIILFLVGNTTIFGSFIKSKVEVGHNIYTKDENAFVFSLNNNKIYKILIPEYALRFDNYYSITIGNNALGNGFWIDLNSNFACNLLIDPKAYDFQKNNELTEGESNLKELEIFEINFN